MKKNKLLPQEKNNRIGFHYYQDTLHYREVDLNFWLPELKELGANWLVLKGVCDHAIPEPFIRGLVSSKISPIIDLECDLTSTTDPNALSTLLEVYSRWGVRFINFFDKPNLRKSWRASAWAQQDLVERFLDRFLPLANAAIDRGLTPIFPALQPGGNFWDTAFLRTALESLERRKQMNVLQNLVLSAYAWTNGKSLNWGAGGPERWPDARPYSTSSTSEDQMGFRIYEWYQEIFKSVIQKEVPTILLQAGCYADPQAKNYIYGKKDLAIEPDLIRLVLGEKFIDPLHPDDNVESINEQVFSCNFWLLQDSHYPVNSLYNPDLTTTDTAERIKKYVASIDIENETRNPSKTFTPNHNHLIAHYVLLPSYEWGVSEWHLEIIQPFIKKYRPTVGYSIEEASLASHVTVIGNPYTFTEESLEELRQNGCTVDRISGDGISIATQIAER